MDTNVDDIGSPEQQVYSEDLQEDFVCGLPAVKAEILDLIQQDQKQRQQVQKSEEKVDRFC